MSTNRIHPTAVIGKSVELGEGNVIGPFTVISGPTVLGDDNWIGPHVTIGTPAQDRAGVHTDASNDHGVRIGDRNRIREYATIQQGTRNVTVVGDDGYFMVGSHVAHDCVIGNSVTMASHASLGGHVHIWAWGNIGIGVSVHQHSRIGPGALIGMGAAVHLRQVGPFLKFVGNPGRVADINEVGLRKLGVAANTIALLRPRLTGKEIDLGGTALSLPDNVRQLINSWNRDLSERGQH